MPTNIKCAIAPDNLEAIICQLAINIGVEWVLPEGRCVGGMTPFDERRRGSVPFCAGLVHITEEDRLDGLGSCNKRGTGSAAANAFWKPLEGMIIFRLEASLGMR